MTAFYYVFACLGRIYTLSLLFNFMSIKARPPQALPAREKSNKDATAVDEERPGGTPVRE
jgi:hypothetical protein